MHENTQTLIVRKNTWTKKHTDEKHRKTWIKNTQTSIVRKSQKLCWLKNSRKNTTIFGNPTVREKLGKIKNFINLVAPCEPHRSTPFSWGKNYSNPFSFECN